MKRPYNHLEEYVRKLLQGIGIYHPHQLNIEVISSRLGLTVHYLAIDSMFISGHIFVDSRKTDAQQWQDFAHELCHVRWHEGDRDSVTVVFGLGK